MALSPFQAAAIGLLVVAAATLAIGLSDRLAQRINDGDAEARFAMRLRMRRYTLWLLIAAVGLSLLGKAL